MEIPRIPLVLNIPLPGTLVPWYNCRHITSVIPKNPWSLNSWLVSRSPRIWNIHLTLLFMNIHLWAMATQKKSPWKKSPSKRFPLKGGTKKTYLQNSVYFVPTESLRWEECRSLHIHLSGHLAALCWVLKVGQWLVAAAGCTRGVGRVTRVHSGREAAVSLFFIAVRWC